VSGSIPDGGPASPASGVSPEDAARSRLLLARTWAYVISATASLPLTQAELEQHLLHLISRLFAAITGEPFEPSPEAQAVGARLVEMRCAGKDSLGRSLELLGTAMVRQPELRGLDRLAERVVRLMAELAAGYTDALTRVTRDRYEGLNQALLASADDARQRHRTSQAHFAEVFRSSSSGIATIGRDGRFLRVNDALGGILERLPGELTGLTVFEVVHLADAEPLRGAYAALLDGSAGQLRQSCRVRCADGTDKRVSITGSPVRETDDARHADHVIAVIEGDSEVSLLQQRLTHQTLHDPLTDLPNRQFFRSRLEKALRQADREHGITVYQLDIDGFSLITGGLGHETADRLLTSVAERLSAVVRKENATVARLGADEFGVIVENSATTPDVVTLVERFTEELSEPVYLDGEHGLAASVSVGVVHRPDPGDAAAEVLRAAEATLHRAKSVGRGQWQLFDPVLDARDRETAALAVSMPGAWENGEIRVDYRPIVRLADGRRVGVEAVLCWDHPERGELRHRECVALAERTGLILPLGAWLLRVAGDRAGRNGWPLSVALTAHQAADPDLVGGIRRIAAEAGLEFAEFEISFPSGALLAERGEATDNLRVLAEIGVRTALHGFGAVADTTFLREEPLHAIRIAPELTAGACPDPDSAVGAVLATVIETAHRAGVRVGVDGVETGEQADSWRAAGVDFALGGLYPPVDGS